MAAPDKDPEAQGQLNFEMFSVQGFEILLIHLVDHKFDLFLLKIDSNKRDYRRIK